MKNNFRSILTIRYLHICNYSILDTGIHITNMHAYIHTYMPTYIHTWLHTYITCTISCLISSLGGREETGCVTLSDEVIVILEGDGEAHFIPAHPVNLYVCMYVCVSMQTCENDQ